MAVSLIVLKRGRRSGARSIAAARRWASQARLRADQFMAATVARGPPGTVGRAVARPSAEGPSGQEPDTGRLGSSGGLREPQSAAGRRTDGALPDAPGGRSASRDRFRMPRRNRSASTTVTTGRIRRGRTRRSRIRAKVLNMDGGWSTGRLGRGPSGLPRVSAALRLRACSAPAYVPNASTAALTTTSWASFVWISRMKSATSATATWPFRSQTMTDWYDSPLRTSIRRPVSAAPTG